MTQFILGLTHRQSRKAVRRWALDGLLFLEFVDHYKQHLGKARNCALLLLSRPIS